MKLWLLKAKPGAHPWSPWYDRAFGFIVRAESEDRARSIASGECGDEEPGAWLDTALSSCEELDIHGPEQMILKDFHAA